MNVIDYFSGKADCYDDVDFQPYWKFSDELLWHLLKSFVLPKKENAAFTLLDAGAGTARWTTKTLESYPRATARLVDISLEMLTQAKKKLEERQFLARAEIQLGDVRDMSHVEKETVNVVFCLHNVVGFFDNSLAAIANFYQKLKKGGKCAVMFPSFYHALYFSNATGRIGQTEKIAKEKRVQYNDAMPPLKVFELHEIEQFQKEAGFKRVQCYGFPVTVYPGMEETFLHGSSATLVKLFNEPYRSQLMEVEKQLCMQRELSPRGNNILAVFEK